MTLQEAITLLRKAFPNIDGFPMVTFYEDESGRVSYRKFVSRELNDVAHFESFEEFIDLIESRINGSH